MEKTQKHNIEKDRHIILLMNMITVNLITLVVKTTDPFNIYKILYLLMTKHEEIMANFS